MRAVSNKWTMVGSEIRLAVMHLMVVTPIIGERYGHTLARVFLRKSAWADGGVKAVGRDVATKGGVPLPHAKI